MGGSVGGQMPACTRGLEPSTASSGNKFRLVWNRLKGKALLESGGLLMQRNGSAILQGARAVSRRGEPGSAAKSQEELIAGAKSIRQLCRLVRGRAREYVEGKTGARAEEVSQEIGRAKKYVIGGIYANEAMSVMKVRLEGVLLAKVEELLNNVGAYDDTGRFGTVMLRNTAIWTFIGIGAKTYFLGGGHDAIMVLFVAVPMAYTLVQSFVLPIRMRKMFEGEKLLREAQREGANV